MSKVSETDRNLKSAYPANSNLNRNYNYTGINFNNIHQSQNANISGPSINNSIQLNNIDVINSVNKNLFIKIRNKKIIIFIQSRLISMIPTLNRKLPIK